MDMLDGNYEIVPTNLQVNALVYTIFLKAKRGDNLIKPQKSLSGCLF